MRKQITLTNKLNNSIRSYSKNAHISQSAVISYALNLLFGNPFIIRSSREELKIIQDMKIYYQNYYIKELPRGKKAHEQRRTNKN